MKKILIILSFFLSVSAQEHNLPINHIISIDDLVYLVCMTHDGTDVGYRTYPFQFINEAGFYELANNVSNQIFINTSNVILDLNGAIVSGGIIVANNLENVTIRNGTVDVNGNAADAIKINSGCANILIKDVAVREATASGICLDQCRDSCIKNCEMTQNSTGISCSNCANIVVQNCTSLCSVITGFELCLSTTCSLLECKALSTGENNTAISGNTIFGFVSADGYGNIFERCIANSTQGLSTTGFNSMIAGFALRGSEGCSKIIDSESANATSSPSSATVPYGILLASVINNPITLQTSGVPTPGDLLFAVNWSPDGVFLATGINTADTQHIRIYCFDRTSNSLIQVATPNVIPGAAVNSVNWSPDGTYLAAGISVADSQRLRIYCFDRINNSLIQVATPNVIPGDSVRSVNWSPDGTYLAIGINTTDTQRIRIYRFDRISNSLIQVATPNVIPGSQVLSVNWSPDGTYLAAGISNAADTQRIRIYRFNQINSLIQVATPNVIPGDVVLSVNWSPDGTYLAAGINSAADTQRIRIYLFDRGTNSLVQVATPNPIPGTTARSVNWSPDGIYLAAGIDNATIPLYNTLTMPSKNIIKNNIIYCNSGSTIPSGIGISGSSISNMIIENTAYSNPIPQTDIEGGGPIVFSNYAFCTNVFNPLFQDMPNALQNISLGGCEPIALRDDRVLLLNQLQSKLCDIQDKMLLLLAANP